MQIAAQLNRLGIKSAKGHTWTRTRVGSFRQIHNIPNRAFQTQACALESTRSGASAPPSAQQILLFPEDI
jgi:hypothetical protein